MLTIYTMKQILKVLWRKEYKLMIESILVASSAMKVAGNHRTLCLELK